MINNAQSQRYVQGLPAGSCAKAFGEDMFCVSQRAEVCDTRNFWSSRGVVGGVPFAMILIGRSCTVPRHGLYVAFHVLGGHGEVTNWQFSWIRLEIGDIYISHNSIQVPAVVLWN
jgi:hypothetical protein